MPQQEFIDYFNEIDDPRQNEKVLYPLHNEILDNADLSGTTISIDAIGC